MATQIKINYKEYPEFMFAMISAYLPAREGDLIRVLAGKVEFKSEDINGNTYKNGLLHSYDDNPAYTDIDLNRMVWYKNGDIHRDGDKPAVIGDKEQHWYKEGLLHRSDDKPAVIDGYYRGWFRNGLRHRTGDKPAVIDRNMVLYYENGNFHRTGDKPAVIHVGYNAWYESGMRHRGGDKPAIVERSTLEWWEYDDYIYGKYRSEENIDWELYPVPVFEEL
jgi:hypothetical protein